MTRRRSVSGDDVAVAANGSRVNNVKKNSFVSFIGSYLFGVADGAGASRLISFQ